MIISKIIIIYYLIGCLVIRKYLYSKMLIDFLQQKKREFSKLSIKEQLLFTLVKLKRNPSLFMLCDLFGISPGVGSNLFITWVLFLAKELAIFLPFSTIKDMDGIPQPKAFESNPALRAIIDCTEFYIHKPSLPSSQLRTHSSYKATRRARGYMKTRLVRVTHAVCTSNYGDQTLRSCNCFWNFEN